MDNLAINEQPKALSQYSRHQIDRTYADQYESVLGHLICERGRSVKAALEDLRPIVSQTRRETLSAIDWCQKLGFGGLGVGILVGAGMGMGFAILPILAGTISIKFWADSRSELPRRDAEYHLLKTTPNLPEALYALHLRGVTAVKIVGAYDQLVAAIEARLEGNGEFTEAEVGEFLQVKVSGDVMLDNVAPSTVGMTESIESAAIAQTELQSPIDHATDAGNMIAAAPSMSVGNGTTTIAPSAAVAPSYGVVKDRSPVDMLVDALFSHRAIFGGQRTGKSLLASIASLGIMEKKPGTKVFYINVFAFDSAETNAMFAHAHRKVIFDLAPASQFQAASIISAVSDLFEEFVQTTGAILIIDEAATMGDIRGNHVDAFRPLVESLTGYLGSIRDSSRKRKKAVWTIAPGIVAADLDPGMKSLMKGFSPILVAIPKLRSVYWDGQLIGSDTNLIAAQLKINYPGYGFEVPQMNCDRACLIDAIWMPLGALSIPASVTLAPTIAPPIEPEESTWVAEGRSAEPFDDSWDLLMKAVAAQAFISTRLDRSIIMSAVNTAQVLNRTGKEPEAIALLQKQLP